MYILEYEVNEGSYEYDRFESEKDLIKFLEQNKYFVHYFKVKIYKECHI